MLWKILTTKITWEMLETYWQISVAFMGKMYKRYLYDVFVRTEVHVILLQICFAAVISVVVALFFNFVYRQVIETVSTGIVQSIQTNSAITGQDIFNRVSDAQAKNFLTFFLITILITIIFSYIIARITLSPAKNALLSQKRFVNDIAHELRNPLSIIRMNSEVALIDESLAPEVREIFKSNIEELDRSSGIIKNLLSFSNMMRPEQLKFEDVDMKKVVTTAVVKMEDFANSKKITLLVETRNTASVWGNITALEQIALNLLKNAINYTPEGGVIEIEVDTDFESGVVLRINDTGVGIDEKDLSRIFEPFYRAARWGKRKASGSGLGLTIVHELVKLHSGKIDVKSRVGQGTSFTVYFPISKNGVVIEQRTTA